MVAGHWLLRGYGFCLVGLKETAEFIGRVGWWQPLDWPGIELGLGISLKFWATGLAQEAAIAALQWGMDNLKTESICSLIHPHNSV
ncbi:MAG: GNAT family N-acetyltransferase [Pseudomonadales bacterium]|nr:GNAT family N-acetyltransferase [Pseudomonadales bacterium]NRA17539.1 GNAT family N-acetyltransferase [Oceanospirillaceae bacterium]